MAAQVTAGSRTMKIHELLGLPVAFDLETAGRAWGLGRTKSHQLARNGQFPCRVQRIGHAYRVTRADLLQALGIQEPEPAAGQQPAAGSSDAA